MTDILLIAFICLVVIYADRVTIKNMGSVYCGIGTIQPVIAGKSLAPMQYRVLVPWIVYGLGKIFGRGTERYPYFNIYITLRWVSVIFSLYASYLFFGSVMAVALLALYFVWAAMFDYTDGYIEVGLFALAFWLMPYAPAWWAYVAMAIVTLLAALNRETAVFIPIAVWLFGDIISGIITACAFMIGYQWTRIKYGDVERYCKFFMVPTNLKEYSEKFKFIPPLYNEYISFTILAMATVGLFIATLCSRPLTPVEISLGVMFCALLIPTKWCEIRVFAPVMLAVIPMAVV